MWILEELLSTLQLDNRIFPLLHPPASPEQYLEAAEHQAPALCPC